MHTVRLLSSKGKGRRCSGWQTLTTWGAWHGTICGGLLPSTLPPLHATQYPRRNPGWHAQFSVGLIEKLAGIKKPEKKPSRPGGPATISPPP